MFIAVASEGITVESDISERFEECKYLLIVNMDDMDVVAIKNEGEHSGENLAYDVVKNDCEAIITGSLNSKTFDIIADACIARYSGTGYSVKKALNLMEQNLLKYIKYTAGSDTCGGTQHAYDGAHHRKEGV